VINVSVQTGDFRLQDEVDALMRAAGDIGAVVCFTGIVRQNTAGDLVALELEHYPGMSENALRDIARQANNRWTLDAVRIIHRNGKLPLGSQIMMVAVTSAHRGEAFSAAEFLMDHLKHNAPFWKKEHCADQTNWVAQSRVDEARLKRWD